MFHNKLLIYNFLYFCIQFIIYFPYQFRSRLGWHELALRDVDSKFGLFGQCEAFPKSIFLFVFTRFPVMLRPGKATHLRGDGRANYASPVVDACIRGAGEDSNLSVSWCVLDIAGKMVSAGEQRSVLRTGTASTVSLPLGFLPFMETVMGKTSFAEVFLDVAFGDVACQYGHAAACQVGQLLLILQNTSVKFLNIHCLLDIFLYICSLRK